MTAESRAGMARLRPQPDAQAVCRRLTSALEASAAAVLVRRALSLSPGEPVAQAEWASLVAARAEQPGHAHASRATVTGARREAREPRLPARRLMPGTDGSELYSYGTDLRRSSEEGRPALVAVAADVVEPKASAPAPFRSNLSQTPAAPAAEKLRARNADAAAVPSGAVMAQVREAVPLDALVLGQVS